MRILRNRRSPPVVPFFALTFTVAVAGSPIARAQSAADTASARDLGRDGQKALDAGDLPTAEKDFRQADDLMQHKIPTLALGLARTYAKEKKWVSAQEMYNRILRDGEPPAASASFHKAWEDASTEVDQVAPHVAGIIINVSGPDNPVVKLDGQLVPVAGLGVKRAVDPGAHVIEASAPGYKSATASQNVAEGAATPTVNLTLEKDSTAGAAATSPPSAGSSVAVTPAPAGPDTGASPGGTQRTLGYVALGVGGVGLVVGALTGVLALGKHGSLSDSCPNGTCPATKQSDVDSFHTLGTVSTVGFIVGALGLGGGAILLLTAPKTTEAKVAWLRPTVGFGTLGAVGRF